MIDAVIGSDTGQSVVACAIGAGPVRHVAIGILRASEHAGTGRGAVGAKAAVVTLFSAIDPSVAAACGDG